MKSIKVNKLWKTECIEHRVKTESMKDIENLKTQRYRYKTEN